MSLNLMLSMILLLMQGSIKPIAAMFLFASLLVPVTTVAVWATDVNEYDEDDIPSTVKEGNIIEGSLLIIGTDDEDIIFGSYTDDTVFAKEADDEIQSGEGQDQVYAGEGNDIIQSGFERDEAFGEGGNDNIIGGPDGDFLYGGRGHDSLFGGFGDDQLTGGSGPDYFNCGDEIDVVKDFNPEEGDIVDPNCEIVLR
jgi:Ca2+-binding RTX toxin-like protein